MSPSDSPRRRCFEWAILLALFLLLSSCGEGSVTTVVARPYTLDIACERLTHSSGTSSTALGVTIDVCDELRSAVAGGIIEPQPLPDNATMAAFDDDDPQRRLPSAARFCEVRVADCILDRTAVTFNVTRSGNSASSSECGFVRMLFQNVSVFGSGTVKLQAGGGVVEDVDVSVVNCRVNATVGTVFSWTGVRRAVNVFFNIVDTSINLTVDDRLTTSASALCLYTATGNGDFFASRVLWMLSRSQVAVRHVSPDLESCAAGLRTSSRGSIVIQDVGIRVLDRSVLSSSTRAGSNMAASLFIENGPDVNISDATLFASDSVVSGRSIVASITSSSAALGIRILGVGTLLVTRVNISVLNTTIASITAAGNAVVAAGIASYTSIAARVTLSDVRLLATRSSVNSSAQRCTASVGICHYSFEGGGGTVAIAKVTVLSDTVEAASSASSAAASTLGIAVSVGGFVTVAVDAINLTTRRSMVVTSGYSTLAAAGVAVDTYQGALVNVTNTIVDAAECNVTLVGSFTLAGLGFSQRCGNSLALNVTNWAALVTDSVALLSGTGNVGSLMGLCASVFRRSDIVIRGATFVTIGSFFNASSRDAVVVGGVAMDSDTVDSVIAENVTSIAVKSHLFARSERSVACAVCLLLYANYNLSTTSVSNLLAVAMMGSFVASDGPNSAASVGLTMYCFYQDLTCTVQDVEVAVHRSEINSKSRMSANGAGVVSGAKMVNMSISNVSIDVTDTSTIQVTSDTGASAALGLSMDSTTMWCYASLIVLRISKASAVVAEGKRTVSALGVASTATLRGVTWRFSHFTLDAQNSSMTCRVMGNLGACAGFATLGQAGNDIIIDNVSVIVSSGSVVDAVTSGSGLGAVGMCFDSVYPAVFVVKNVRVIAQSGSQVTANCSRSCAVAGIAYSSFVASQSQVSGVDIAVVNTTVSVAFTVTSSSAVLTPVTPALSAARPMQIGHNRIVGCGSTINSRNGAAFIGPSGAPLNYSLTLVGVTLLLRQVGSCFSAVPIDATREAPNIMAYVNYSSLCSPLGWPKANGVSLPVGFQRDVVSGGRNLSNVAAADYPFPGLKGAADGDTGEAVTFLGTFAVRPDEALECPVYAHTAAETTPRWDAEARVVDLLRRIRRSSESVGPHRTVTPSILPTFLDDRQTATTFAEATSTADEMTFLTSSVSGTTNALETRSSQSATESPPSVVTHSVVSALEVNSTTDIQITTAAPTSSAATPPIGGHNITSPVNTTSAVPQPPTALPPDVFLGSSGAMSRSVISAAAGAGIGAAVAAAFGNPVAASATSKATQLGRTVKLATVGCAAASNDNRADVLDDTSYVWTRGEAWRPSVMVALWSTTATLVGVFAVSAVTASRLSPVAGLFTAVLMYYGPNLVGLAVLVTTSSAGLSDDMMTVMAAVVSLIGTSAVTGVTAWVVVAARGAEEEASPVDNGVRRSDETAHVGDASSRLPLRPQKRSHPLLPLVRYFLLGTRCADEDASSSSQVNAAAAAVVTGCSFPQGAVATTLRKVASVVDLLVGMLAAMLSSAKGPSSSCTLLAVGVAVVYALQFVYLIVLQPFREKWEQILACANVFGMAILSVAVVIASSFNAAVGGGRDPRPQAGMVAQSVIEYLSLALAVLFYGEVVIEVLLAVRKRCCNSSVEEPTAVAQTQMTTSSEPAILTAESSDRVTRPAPSSLLSQPLLRLPISAGGTVVDAWPGEEDCAVVGDGRQGKIGHHLLNPLDASA